MYTWMNPKGMFAMDIDTDIQLRCHGEMAMASPKIDKKNYRSNLFDTGSLLYTTSPLAKVKRMAIPCMAVVPFKGASSKLVSDWKDESGRN